MRTWGVGLYSSDTALDLRDDLDFVVRAPWEADEIRSWAVSKYPGLADPDDQEHTDLCLVLADRFWRYGIEHSGTFEEASSIVSSGADAKRALGMHDRDLGRRD